MTKRAGVAATVGKLTSSQRVELYIKEAILHGELKPRERIIEAELAKSVGCSRAPVRQAVQRLVREGLIVTVPRRGVFIRDFTPGAVDEIFRMRSKLEALCVRYMRKKITAKDEAALRQALEPMAAAQAAGDQEAFLEADMNLHRLIWRLSGCQEIQRTLNAIMVPFILMVARLTTPQLSLAEGLKHHQDYLEVILKTPVEEVEMAVERYFMAIYDRLFRPAETPERRMGTATWLLDGSY